MDFDTLARSIDLQEYFFNKKLCPNMQLRMYISAVNVAAFEIQLQLFNNKGADLSVLVTGVAI